MRDPIPSVSDGIVDRQVCRMGANDSCVETMTIKVKNCGTFRVYYLIRTNGCSKGYCFGTKHEAASKHCVCPEPGSTGNAHSSKTPSRTDDNLRVWLSVVISILVVIIIIIILRIIYRYMSKRNRVDDITLNTIKPRERRIRH